MVRKKERGTMKTMKMRAFRLFDQIFLRQIVEKSLRLLLSWYKSTSVFSLLLRMSILCCSPISSWLCPFVVAFRARLQNFQLHIFRMLLRYVQVIFSFSFKQIKDLTITEVMGTTGTLQLTTDQSVCLWWNFESLGVAWWRILGPFSKI